MTARTEEYARLAAQGKTCAEIAKACGVSRPAVSMWAKRHGVKLPDHRLSPAHAAHMSRNARARYADPAFNPLAALTPDERVEYEKAKRRGPRTLALIVIGRMDLIRDGNAVTPHSSRPGGHAPGSAPKGAGAAKEAPITPTDVRGWA